MEHRDALLNQTFNARTRTIRELSLEIGLKHGLSTLDVTKLLDTVASLADHRNDIIHGWIHFDEERKVLVFKNKNKPGRRIEATAIDGFNRRLLKCLLAFGSFPTNLLCQIAD